MTPTLPRPIAAQRPVAPPWRRLAAGSGAGLLILAGLAAGPSQAASDGATAAPAPLPADCNLAWQVALLPEIQTNQAHQTNQPRQPRQLRVTLSFDAGNRQHSHLRLPAGWAALDDSPDLPLHPPPQAVPDEPTLRRVAHAAGARVTLHWQHSLPASAGAAGAWWLFSGQALLPMPDELADRPPALACISLAAPGLADAAASRWLSSHGTVDGPNALWRLTPNGDSLRSRVQQALYAGGAWQLQTMAVDGQALTVARPDSPALAVALPALAQAGAHALAVQRRHWGETQPGPPLMLWALPVDRAAAAPAPSGALARASDSAWGSAWHRTAVVQVAANTAPASTALDAAVTQALSRLWLLDRFGPLVQAGRDDAPLRRWFSDGVADFLAHQALLRDQRWTAADLASHYQRQIDRWAEPNPPGWAATDPAALDVAAARGEWLALQWHAQLRAQGQPGLDALLRRLLLAPAQARREGPISAPLATHRLVAALRARLGDLPLREVQRVVERGEPAWVYPGTLAACFNVDQTPGQPLRVQARPEALQQPACQGWLGLGPEAHAAQRGGPPPALADAGTPQAAAPHSARAGMRAAGKASSRSQGAKLAGKAKGKAGAKPVKKPGGKARKR